MKLYRLMVSILCMALLMVLWGCFPCVAEILVRDGHVTGGKDIDRKSFTYDFALPAEIKHVKQYKTELISMNLSHVASVLEGFTQKPRSGDSWGIMNSSQWPCTNFCYFEQNGKSRDISQTNLAQELGIDKSTLSRFLTEKTNKLSSDCLVAIAGYFGVSTDFLLGLTNIATRKNYDIEALGLSASAAANLAQGRVRQEVVSQLLENLKFAELTQQIALYQQGFLASGVAAQNQFYSSMSSLLLEHGKAHPEDRDAAKEAVQQIQAFKRPIYADEVDSMTRSFRQILSEMKQDGPERAKQSAITVKESLKESTDLLPRENGGLSVSPEGVMNMLAMGLDQIEVPEAYRAEMGAATDGLKQAISDYFTTMYTIHMKELTLNERNTLPDDSKQKP